MPPPTSYELAVYLEQRSGLRFTPYQIACYLTALQTKGFVILSGLSGTGKTKLAQAFAELLGADDGTNHLFLPVRPDWRDSKALIGYYNPILERYEATALLRFVLAARQAHETPRQASLVAAVRAGLERPDNKRWLEDLDAMLKGLAGKHADQLSAEDLHSLWVQQSNGVSSIGQATSMKLPDDARLREATAIVMDMARTPGQRFIDAVKVLAPPNHWARVWRAVAACDIANVHTIVHGRRVRELLGYLDFESAQDPRDLAVRNKPDEIDEGLRFIMDQVDRQLPGLGRLERAIAPWLMWEYFEGVARPAVPAQKPAGGGVAPFFLLLDEMNLAHVEHYFADFLSVLESGRRENGFTLEEIRLHAFDTPVADGAGGTIPPALALPPNLYIIGTVNVDETTHAFSPKVLDRAFTIEFEGADLAAYPPNQVGASLTLPDERRSALLAAFTREGRFVQNAKAPDITGAPARDSSFMAQLRDLEQLLRPYELHFAYRVVDDILAYLANAEAYRWFDGLGGLDAAFDSAVLMKVLPKFHGSRSRLQEPLHRILEWTGMPLPDPDDPATAATPGYQADIKKVRSSLVNGSGSEFKYPRTALKCLRMLYQLAVTGFASFS